MSLFIVIEAVDLAGKSTQIEALSAALRSRGLSVATTGYPDPTAPVTGPLIEQFRTGRVAFVADPTSDPIGNMLIGQSLFSLNRRECSARLEDLIARHDVVVSSRYQLSGRVYAEAKGVEPAEIAALHNGLEGDLRRADVTLVIDVDPAVVALRPRSEGLDAFERDRALQIAVRAGYQRAAANDSSIHLVDGSGSPEVITSRLLDALAPSL